MHIATRYFGASYVVGFFISILMLLLPSWLFAAEGTLAVSLLPSPAAGVSEYIELSLTGEGALELSGWRIEDVLATPSTVYTFPTSTPAILHAGATIRICQGALATPPTAPCDAHFGGTAKWNNGGDTLRLLRANGDEVLALPYTTVTTGEIVETALIVQTVGPTPEPEPNPEPEPDPIPPASTSTATSTPEPEPVPPTPTSTATSTPDPVPEEEETEPVPPPVAAPRFVTFCKATNSHYIPFVKLKLPSKLVLRGRGVSDADVVPVFGTYAGQNLDELYAIGKQTLTGKQILDRKCKVQRPYPRRHSWWWR